MGVWQNYKKDAVQAMRPYVVGEDLTGVSVSKRDTPEKGGMIAMGADDGALWYVSKTFFNENYVLYDKNSEKLKELSVKFVKHIHAHLGPGKYIYCKICNKSFNEITAE